VRTLPPLAENMDAGTDGDCGLSTKCGRQSIEGYAHDGDLSVDRCVRHESDGNKTQDTRFIQIQAISMT
jgi:hypothetical protein